jgi:hypothetical protein
MCLTIMSSRLRAEQDRDHLGHVGAAHRPLSDPPQVELVRGAGVLPVDRVPAVHDPRADQQHVVAGLAGEPAQRRGDHGAGMTAQHVPGVHVPGVAGIPGDRLSWVSEPVVVVGDRNDPGIERHRRTKRWGHACEIETSVAMALTPDLVATGQVVVI